MSQILYVFSQVSTFDDVLHPTKLMTENTVSSLLFIIIGLPSGFLPINDDSDESNAANDPSSTPQSLESTSDDTMIGTTSSKSNNDVLKSINDPIVFEPLSLKNGEYWINLG
jgi:hypothetical protein